MPGSARPSAPMMSENAMGYFFSLSKSGVSTGLDISEWILLIFGLVLVIGIFGEYKKVPRCMATWPKAVFEILVMIGVAGELCGDGGVFLFSRQLQILEGADIQALDTKSRDARERANDALSKSGMAVVRAGEADNTSKGAMDKAGKAERSLTSALDLAKGARQEADSFERDIVAAKKQAAEAESHLAEALKEASAAQAELNLLKTPRSLTNVAALISALQTFNGTQFGFTGIYGDQESIDLAEKISDGLQLAGWKPTGSPTTGHGSVAIRLQGFSGGAVGLSVSTGVHVGATSEETPEAINKLTPADRPQQINAAIALKNALALSISPKQDGLADSSVTVEKFNKFTEVLIDVGNKPTTSNKPASH